MFSSFSLAVGFFVIFEANFIFQLDGKFTLDGWVEFGIRNITFFDSFTYWEQNSRDFEVIFYIFWKTKIKIYDFGIDGFVAATTQFALDLYFKFNGTKGNKIKAFVSEEVVF